MSKLRPKTPETSGLKDERLKLLNDGILIKLKIKYW